MSTTNKQEKIAWLEVRIQEIRKIFIDAFIKWGSVLDPSEAAWKKNEALAEDMMEMLLKYERDDYMDDCEGCGSDDYVYEVYWKNVLDFTDPNPKEPTK